MNVLYADVWHEDSNVSQFYSTLLAEGGGFEPPKVSLTRFPSVRTRPLCDPS